MWRMTPPSDQTQATADPRVREALRRLREQGLIYSRFATAAEARGKTGRRPLLFSHDNPVPRRRVAIIEQPQRLAPFLRP